MRNRRTKLTGLVLVAAAGSVAWKSSSTFASWKTSNTKCLGCHHLHSDAHSQGRVLAKTTLHSLPEGPDMFHQLDMMTNIPVSATVEGLSSSLQDWFQTHLDIALPDIRPIAPAYAEEMPVQALPAVDPVITAKPLPELDPNVKYLYGANGQVLREPSSQKPLIDDWWNAAVGFQCSIIKSIDKGLRTIGVPGAFGWTIFLWTFLFKLLLYPLEKDSLRTMAMSKMLAPKVQEIQEKFKGNDDKIRHRTNKLNEIFGTAGGLGCLALFVQLPLIFTLFYSWRRLRAEQYENFSEPFLWIPSLAQPNPDFQFNFEWLLQFNESSEPLIGWDCYLRQLILPAIVIAITAWKSRPDGEEKDRNLFLYFLPISLTAMITLELPQLMSVYYSAYNLVGLAEVELVKYQIREEMPLFKVFEETGQFPEGNFDEVFFPDSIHEVCKKGNVRGLQFLLEEKTDINELDEHGNTALGYAAVHGHLPVVAVLCLSGADIMAKDPQDNTVLHYAAAYDKLDVLKYLLVHGEQSHEAEYKDNQWATWKNKNGFTVVDMAKMNPLGQVLQYLNAELGLGLPVEAAATATAEVAAQAAAPVKARASRVD